MIYTRFEQAYLLSLTISVSLANFVFNVFASSVDRISTMLELLMVGN
jgi:hypothetical protein